ncbi:MAG: hypothetical protein JWO09_2964 [Bacteroidetes bacterium]|nr:hypothetical protein [Bacteroidota bacterium]
MLHKSTFDFLSKLKKNNSKEWFDKNRPEYEIAKNDYKEFIQELINTIGKFDPAVKALEPKHCVFRINRDIRFSNDKTPYKVNMGASIAPGGKKSITPGYYIHIQPGASFLAGGMWQPPAPQLSAIRQEIDYNTPEFKKLTGNKDFKKYFGALSDEDKVKTSPKGYDKGHPEIESLKLKSFIMVHDLKDKEVLSKDFIKHCEAVFKAMLPMNKFLRRACD